MAIAHRTDNLKTYATHLRFHRLANVWLKECLSMYNARARFFLYIN